MTRIRTLYEYETEASKSEGQIAHERFHATMAELGASAYKKGWEALTDDSKTAWQAAAEAVLAKCAARKGQVLDGVFRPLADPPYQAFVNLPVRHGFSPRAWRFSFGEAFHKGLEEGLKKEEPMQDTLNAANNEIQRLRGQLEQTQRELSNARMKRDEATAELSRERLQHDETKSLWKGLQKQADDAIKARRATEQANADLLQIVESLCRAQRWGQGQAIFDVQRRVDASGFVEIQARRLHDSNVSIKLFVDNSAPARTFGVRL